MFGPDDALLAKPVHNHWNQDKRTDGRSVITLHRKLADEASPLIRRSLESSSWHAGGSANDTPNGFESARRLTDARIFLLFTGGR
jgi:hypothetical protein